MDIDEVGKWLIIPHWVGGFVVGVLTTLCIGQVAGVISIETGKVEKKEE